MLFCNSDRVLVYFDVLEAFAVRASFIRCYHGRMADALTAKKALLHLQVLGLPSVARRRLLTHTYIHNVTGKYLLVYRYMINSSDYL